MDRIIEKLDYEGRGIARENNKVIFVPRTIPGERVTTHLLKKEKNYEIHVLDEILDSSKQRVSSYCPYASLCGGCTYDIISYQDSLEYKKELMKELFLKNNIILENLDIVPSIPSLNYRNKITLKVNNKHFGYYKNESHEFVKIKNCLLASSPIQNFLEDFSLLNLEEGEIMIRSNDNQELLLSITSEDQVNILEELTTKHKIAGIVWNNKCVYGLPYFFEKRDGLIYKVRYSSFFQVNRDIASKIKEEVVNSFKENDEVLDLYCGVGFFSLPLAKKVKKVTGIEYNSLAIVDAIYNASLNNIENTQFHAGKVEDILDKISGTYNKVVVDPPRAGLNKKVVEEILNHRYEEVLYISCNPFTLVRDLKLLVNHYNIKKITLYDMFSYTSHVECVTLLCLKETSKILEK